MLGFLAMFQLSHHYEISRSLHKYQYRIPGIVYKQIHLSVPKTASVRIGRTVMNTCLIIDIGGLCVPFPPLWPTFGIEMSSMQGQFSAFIRINDMVDSLAAHRHISLNQNPFSLFGRLRFIHNKLFYPPYENLENRPFAVVLLFCITTMLVHTPFPIVNLLWGWNYA